MYKHLRKLLILIYNKENVKALDLAVKDKLKFTFSFS